MIAADLEAMRIRGDGAPGEGSGGPASSERATSANGGGESRDGGERSEEIFQEKKRNTDQQKMPL